MILLGSMTQSILIATAELNSPGPFIVYVNKAFEEMTGWKREEIIGENPRTLQGPKSDLSIFYNLNEILDNGETWEEKTVNYKKGGTDFFMEWSIASVFDKKGGMDKLLAVQNDITENVHIRN
jgi:PAS domain S-box-containing protein